jgi:hypothetical protein
MKSKIKPVVLIASIFLSIISILHILRIVFDVEIVINNWSVPFWINGLLAIITACLATMLWRENR